MGRKLPAVIIMLSLAGACEAGSWLEDTLMDAGKRLGERAIHESTDSAYEGAKGTLKGEGGGEGKDRSAADREEESGSRKAAKRASGGRSGSSGAPD